MVCLSEKSLTKIPERRGNSRTVRSILACLDRNKRDEKQTQNGGSFWIHWRDGVFKNEALRRNAVGDDGMSLKCRNQQDSESYQRALQTYVSAGRGEFSS